MKNLLLTIVIGAVVTGAYSENRTMFVHHNGTVTPIFYAEIDSMRVSTLALDSVQTSIPTVHEVWTPDSIYRIEIASIDSITFQSPKPIAVSNAVDLSGELAPYITGCEYFDLGESSTGYQLKLNLKSDTPTNLIPQPGTLLYQADPSETLPNGFAGEVGYHYGGIATEIWCDIVDPETMFETLAWTSETGFQPEQTENGPSRVALPTLGSNLSYPDLIEGTIVMTDELKDIPAGPERAQIKAELRVTPNVRTYAGHYVFKRDDGTFIRRRRLFTKITADVRASVSGRENAKETVTVNDRGGKVSFDFPIGFGTNGALTYAGALTVQGKMGLDYNLECKCESSTLTDITIEEDEYGYLDVVGEHRYTHKQMEVPTHTLDASMDGEVSLTGNISVTAFKTTGFEGTLTNVFSYGAKLKGSALFLNSEINDAATDNALYQRITSTGITAIPVESITSTAKYNNITYKRPIKLPRTPSETFYAVPHLSSPSYDKASRTIHYNVEGKPMSFSQSRLGAAVQHKDGAFTWTSTNYIWPQNTVEGFDAQVNFDLSKGESIYPTVTLPGGQRILASPAYPTVGNQLLPITSFQENNGVIVTSGSPFTGSAVSGNHGVYVGTVIPVK